MPKKKDKRGGPGRGQGRRLKYGEPTVKVNYRVPVSMKPEIDTIVSVKLSEALQKHISSNTKKPP